MAKTARKAKPQRTPTLTMVGAFPLVTPHPVERLHHKHRETIGLLRQIQLVELDPVKEARVAQTVRRRLLAMEHKLGVTVEDRIEAVRDVEPYRAMMQAAATNANEPPAPCAPAELPTHERGMAAADVARWEKARAELTSPTLNLKDRQREGRAATMAQVERAPKDEADKAWRAQAIGETISLAEARGQDITGLRIASHDGLYSLYVLGRLTQEQYDEGVLFRRAWNKRSGDLTPPPPGEGSHSAHQHEAFMAAKSLRAFDLQRLGKITIHVALYGSPNALTMLNRVAGDGTALRVFGGGRAFERNLTDLQKALDLCANIPAKDRDRRG